MKVFSFTFIFMIFTIFNSNAAPKQFENCSLSQYTSWFSQNPAPRRLLCGYIEVPMEYKDKASEKASHSDKTITLATTVLPAKNKRAGSLIIISGGPGQPGINPIADTDPFIDELNNSWDIVGYDPRGVGQSKPKINCMTKTVNEDLSDEQQIKNKIAACLNNTDIDLLKHVGSDEAANDVDKIRQAFDDDKATILAYSYGTQVALLYAERFPNFVRAMVLDGVVDLNEAKDDFDLVRGQALSYQKTFEHFIAWCAKIQNCNFSSDPNTASQQYRDLLKKLDESPLYGQNNKRFSPDDLILLTQTLLLWQDTWEYLVFLTDELQRDIVSEDTIKILNNMEGSVDEDALYIINCLDRKIPNLTLNESIKRKQIIAEAFPAINYKNDNVDVEFCDLWPWNNNVHDKRPALPPQLPPLLFIAHRYDPTTPWQNAKNMANYYGGYLLTVEGDGHTISFSDENPCIDRNVVLYLLFPDAKIEENSCSPNN